MLPLNNTVGIQYYEENNLNISNEKWKLIIIKDITLLTIIKMM